MKRAVLALALLWPAPALADDPLFALYADGKYEAAMRAGEASHTAPGLAVAARAALADAVLRPDPCMDCLKRGEADARAAIAADPRLADGQVWLAVALGYQSRLTGILRARLRDAPGQARAALEAAIAADPKNPYAVSALGGYRVQGKRDEDAARMRNDALALEAAGASMVVLEMVPARLAADITGQMRACATIGIGAGSGTAGQVLVMHDMLGINLGRMAKFVRNFMQGAPGVQAAFADYVAAVKNGTFPDDALHAW